MITLSVAIGVRLSIVTRGAHVARDAVATSVSRGWTREAVSGRAGAASEHPMDNAKPYLQNVHRWERLFAQHGDSPQALGSRDIEMERVGFEAVLDILAHERAPITLLDFGCGPARLYDYMLQRGMTHVAYTGLDLSPTFLDCARRKHPVVPFLDLDVLERPEVLGTFDYVVLSGVLTSRSGMSYSEAWSFMTRTLQVLFGHTSRGLAFNVGSKQVDWERDDLFHVPFDDLATFIRSNLSDRFAFRHDYGYYEYTTYVYPPQALVTHASE